MFVKKGTENPLVVSLSLLLPILLLTGSNNLLNSALICHNLHFQSISQYPRKPLQNRAFPGQIKENQNYDKSTIHLPRQHLPFPNVRIRIKRHGGTAWLDRTI